MPLQLPDAVSIGASQAAIKPIGSIVSHQAIHPPAHDLRELVGAALAP
jgi:hypothetical protein